MLVVKFDPIYMEHANIEAEKALMRQRMAARHRTARRKAAKAGDVKPWILARRTFADPANFGLRFAFRKKRKDARRLGHHFYYTGRHCSHGHYALRYTWNGVCMACAKDERFIFFTIY